MMQQTEERIRPSLRSKKTVPLSELLEYYIPVADGVQLLKNDGFLGGWRLRGPDMSNMSIADASDLCARLEDAFRLGEGWTIQSDQCQSPATEYHTIPEGQWGNPVSRLIDKERELFFGGGEEFGHCFNSDFYLSVTYHPPNSKSEAAADWLFSTDERGGTRLDRELEKFQRTMDDIHAVLVATLRGENCLVERLGEKADRMQRTDELSRYMRRCISGEDYPFAMPPEGEFVPLDQLLAEDFVSGRYPQLGVHEDARHICTVAIKSFPEAPGSGSFPAMMAALSALPFPFRFTQQGRCLSETAAQKMHQANAGRWGTIKTGLRFMKNVGRREDPKAARLEDQATDEGTAAAHGIKRYVKYTAKVILMHSNRDTLIARYRAVKNQLRTIGFGCDRESVNASWAWISSLPGHAHRERRLFVATVRNFSHLAQVSSPFLGQEWNPALKFFPPRTPPLLYACAMGSTPMRFHAHVGGEGATGHMLLAGPSGSGKTTKLAAMVAQFPRIHPDGQIFCFDKEKTLYTTIHAMGGDYYDLSVGTALQFCPLQNIDDPNERAWAQPYLEMLCSLNDLTTNASQRNSISDALEVMTGQKDRSLTHFQALIASEAPEVAQALQYYTIGAVGGGLLDGVKDNLALGRVAAFDVGKLYLGSPRITAAVLFYLFHRIEKRFDPSRPMMVTVDELRASLEHKGAVDNLEKFLIEGRKQNMFTVLAIQELGKILKSPLSDTIARECKTKVFLANREAVVSEREVYEMFGADGRDVEAIAELTSGRDYYVISPSGRCSFNLKLSDMALAFLAKSGDRDREVVKQLMANHPHDWQVHWLRAQPRLRSDPKYYSDWADILETYIEEANPYAAKAIA